MTSISTSGAGIESTGVAAAIGHGVEFTGDQFLDQRFRLRLAQFDDEIRMAEVQERQQFGEQVGPERWNDAELQLPFEQLAAMTGKINEVAGCREHFIAPLGHQDADFRQCRVPRPAFDELNVKLLLQFANLHGERRLCDGAGVSGAAEMTVARERLEIPQLAEGDHEVG